MLKRVLYYPGIYIIIKNREDDRYTPREFLSPDQKQSIDILLSMLHAIQVIPAAD